MCGRYRSSGARSENYDYEDGEGPPSPPANVSYPPPVVYASNPPAFPLYSQVRDRGPIKDWLEGCLAVASGPPGGLTEAAAATAVLLSCWLQ